MNDVKLFGYLGRDFETDYTQSGICYAKNSIAITQKWKNKKGNEETKTTWIPIVLFGKIAENAFIYFPKGSQFLCSGKLDSSEYIDKDGNKRTYLSVIVSRFYWIGKKSEMANGEQKEKPKTQAKPTQKQGEVPKEPEIVYSDSQVVETESFTIEESDMPF